MDASHTVGNGFTYQGKLSSSKLTSVLEAVAGEYALVINGHSLVRLAVPSRREHAQTLWSACPELFCSLAEKAVNTVYAFSQYCLGILPCSQLPLT